MRTRYHTVVIGGGCLGCASAISVRRRLQQTGKADGAVCVLEKSFVGSGLTARHSGIVRSANAVPIAAKLRKLQLYNGTRLRIYGGLRIVRHLRGHLDCAR